MSGYENSRSCVCKAGQPISAMHPCFNYSVSTLTLRHRCAQKWTAMQQGFCRKLIDNLFEGINPRDTLCKGLVIG